jgi:hypothetical protein
MTSTGGSHFSSPSPPGWYLDPGGGGGRRWWDGLAWTEHLAPPTSTPAHASGPSHLDLDCSLDRAVAEDLASGIPWGAGEAAWAYGAVVPALLLTAVIAVALNGGAAVLIGELLLGAGVFMAGRRVARERGGWFHAFGFQLPKRSDLKPGLLFASLQLLARIPVGIVFVILIPSLRASSASNLPSRSGYSTAALIALTLCAVVVSMVSL